MPSGKRPRRKSISAKRQNAVFDVMEREIADGHFGTRFTGVTPSPFQNVRGHFGSPDTRAMSRAMLQKQFHKYLG